MKDLWLPNHDAKVRELRKEVILGYAEAVSPFGTCCGLSYGGRLIALRFEESGEELRKEWPLAALEDSGETRNLLLRAFDSPGAVPVLAIGTPFQLAVWEQLRAIPHAATMTYGEVARLIGRPSAARAVGRAVGSNSLAVVIPCHRVVSRGKLTGYRWGLERKRALLDWELSRRDPLAMPF